MNKKAIKPVEGDPHPTMNKARRNEHYHISEAGRSNLAKTNQTLNLAMHQRAVDIDIEQKQLAKELKALRGGRKITPNTGKTWSQDDTGTFSSSLPSRSEILYRRRRSRSFADISDDIKKLADIPEVQSRNTTPDNTYASVQNHRQLTPRDSDGKETGYTKRTRSISTPVAPLRSGLDHNGASSPTGRPWSSSLPARLQRRAFEGTSNDSSTSSPPKKATSMDTNNSLRHRVLRRTVSEDTRLTKDRLFSPRPPSVSKPDPEPGPIMLNRGTSKSVLKTSVRRVADGSAEKSSKTSEQRSYTPVSHGRRRSSSLTDIAKFTEIIELNEGRIPSVADLKNELKQRSRTEEMIDETESKPSWKYNRRRSSSLSDLERFQQMRKDNRLPSVVGLPSRSQTKEDSPSVPPPRTYNNRRRSSSLSDLERYQNMKKEARSPSITGRPHHMEERARERKRSESIYQSATPVPHGSGRRRSSVSDVKLYHDTFSRYGTDVAFEDDNANTLQQYDELQDCRYLRMYIPKYMR